MSDPGNTSLPANIYWMSLSTILKISHWICHISVLKDSLIKRIYKLVPPQNLRVCNLHITPTHKVHYCYCNCIDRRKVSISPALSHHYSLGYWNFFASSLLLYLKFLMSFTMEWMNEWCFKPWLCTVRLNWARDNLGEWDEFCYESCPWPFTMESH